MPLLTAIWYAVSCFNPHPARRPDAISSAWAMFRAVIGFNPHPARRPDAIVAGDCTVADFQVVSILTRPEGRMQ